MPATDDAPGPVTVKVVSVSVVVSITSLKAAVIFLLIGTSVSVSAGVVEVTVGAVVSPPPELFPPPPPPHAAREALSSKAKNHISGLE